jgi:hypothetical protein
VETRFSKPPQDVVITLLDQLIVFKLAASPSTPSKAQANRNLWEPSQDHAEGDGGVPKTFRPEI